MTRHLSPQSSLEHLKKEAKRWLKSLRANDAGARARLERAYPKAPADPVLRDVQYALAKEYGFDNWKALRDAVIRLHPMPAVGNESVETYEALARDMVTIYATGEDDALQRLNRHYGQSLKAEDFRAMVWGAIRTVREAKGAARAFGGNEAQRIIAALAGFGSWQAFTDAIVKGSPAPGPLYELNDNAVAPRRLLSDKEWDQLIDVTKDQRIPALRAHGLMTDSVLERISRLDHVTSLSLGGSRQLTDEGLLHLARMPQLQHLDLNGGGGLTDRGLEALSQLSELHTFEAAWQGGFTDQGFKNLERCDKLQVVNLMGTPSGDGAIQTLRGKPMLRRLHTGKLVTDAALPLLHDFPLYKRPQDGVESHLLIDGPFTNEGVAALAGLDGLSSLGFFWHVSAMTPDALAVLGRLSNLTSLMCEGELCTDEAMLHIAALPRLRRLQCQETVATDEGFIALSRLQTLEGIWGRRVQNLTGRGFVALSKMPVLQDLGVSCKSVSDDALSSLPHFPALRRLTPIDVQDAGFRHVGRCTNLQDLSCMYCRDITDVATEHIRSLSRLKRYYAGATQITDRSLECLSRISSLENIEFYECKGVTDAGLPFLARMPNLREISLSGLPQVTFDGTGVFPPHVRVNYSTAG